MFRTVPLLELALLCGLESASAIGGQQWTDTEFLGTDSGMEQGVSPLLFGRMLNEEHAVSKLSRVARDAPDGGMECCIKDEKKFTPNETSVITKCSQEMQLQQAGQQWTVKTVVCVVDCIAKGFDVVDGDGYLDAEKSMKVVKANDQWGQVLVDKNDLINRCVTFANSFSKERGAVMLDERKCNIASAAAANCIKSMAEINCPENRRVASAQCDGYRRKLGEVIDVLNI